MKKSLVVFLSIFFIHSFLFAQKNEKVIVEAGNRVIDYFPPTERYLYSDFTNGKAIFSNDRIYPSKFNYNILSGEIEYLDSNDTLFIADKRDLILIEIEQDTFYYENGYLQMIQSGHLKVFLKQSIVIKDILKKGAMGTVNRSAASESYDYMLTGFESKDMVADIDMALQKEETYFFSKPGDDFIRFNKKNALNIVPYKKKEVKGYISSNKIDFKKREDLLKLTDFISTLLPKEW